MNKILAIFVALSVTLGTFAQSPEKISYQAVIRDGSNVLVTNAVVGMQMSILQGSATGSAVYLETQTPTTNNNGLVSINIGDGATSDDFYSIDWADGPYFLKTEIDPVGGTSYSISGTSQLLSVPYALHAKTADNVIGGISETDPIYTDSEASNITATDISNLENLSGTNSGNQDISGISVNTKAIQDTAFQIRADIPDISGLISLEADPIYNGSIASGINEEDTVSWNNKLDSYTEIQNLDNVLLQGTSAGNRNITNLAKPINAQDAATKSYVDKLKVQIEELQLIVGIKDVNGNQYKIVKIGNQVWMAENLRTNKYADGTPISSDSYMFYDDDSITYAGSYGALYTWTAAMNGESATEDNPSNVQGVCPNGWHLPSFDEWTDFHSFLTSEGHSGNEGNVLKSTSAWLVGNGTDNYSFNGLPAGFYKVGSGFLVGGYETYWWSASLYDFDIAYADLRVLSYNNTRLSEGYGDISSNFLSVRCVKN